MRAKRFVHILSIVALFSLSGCGGFDRSFGGFSPTPISSLDGAENGSTLARTMPWSDVETVSNMAWQALQMPQVTEDVAWSNRNTGSSGTVMPGPVYLVGFNAGAEIEAPLQLDVRPYLEPAAGNYITVKNSNVRLSPNIRGAKATMLELGSTVQAVGREPADDWFLVSQNDRVMGYVYGPLLSRAEGGDLLLAGGDATRGRLCRELTYTITLGTGETDAWVNGACKAGDEPWSIVGGRQLILG